MDGRRTTTWFFVALLIIVLYFAWLMFLPFLSALVIAGIFAFLLRPLYLRFAKFLHNESLAGLGIIAAVALIIFLPLGFFGLRIFAEATALYRSLAAPGGFNFITAINSFFLTHFPGIPSSQITISIDAYAQEVLTWLIQHLGSLFSDVLQVFFMAFLSLLGLFYFLKDGNRLKAWIVETVPLERNSIEEIIHQIEAIGTSVLKGTLSIAIIDGIVMGVGFYFFHIPDPSFWGALTIPISIIPMVGTWLVAVPAIAYLLLTSQIAAGIGLALWSIVLINLIYNLLSPQLMRHGSNIHPFVILLSILGGVSVFGPIGFLIGPLIIGLLFVLLKAYQKLPQE